MSRFRTFIIPFKDDGTYGEEVEVTSDTNFGSISKVKQQLDQNEFKVGVLTFNDLNIKLRNEHGKYSDPTVPESIFRYRRSGAIFRLYWEIADHPPYCGVALAGDTFISETKLIYEGLINDDATKTNIRDQNTSLKVLGLESIITAIEVPFADLSIGQTLSNAIFKILDQNTITDFISVLESNISVGFNTTMDSVAHFESETGKEALDELLLISNSILYIKERVLYITGRTASADSQFTFYGPASINGLENLISISDIRTGLSKAYNFWTWKDETFNVVNSSSIASFGVKKRAVDSKAITNLTKQQNILADLATEFGDPKESFRIKVAMNYKTMELFFLDKINIDYPTVYVASEGDNIPVYEISKYDEGVYPIPESTLTIDVNRNFKILGVNISTKNQTIEFNIKEI